MRFVPIPTTEDALRGTRKFWLPFIPRIADRSDETVDELLDLVVSGRVQIALVWDESKNEARALIGLSYRKLGREIVGEVHWAAGFGVKDWQHLLPQVERYLKDVNCTIMKPICRPGWKRFLKQHGFRQTHVVMEKML